MPKILSAIIAALFAVSALFVAGVARAGDLAQVAGPSPSPSATPVHAAPHRQPITLSIKPSIQWFTSGDLNPVKTASNPSSVTLLGWHVGYDVTKKLTISFDQSNPGALNGRYYPFNPNGTCCSSRALYLPVSVDNIIFTGATYSFTPNFYAGLGYERRWRLYAGGACDPTNTNPAIWSGADFRAGWNVGPNTIVGRPLSFVFDVVDTDHHANAAAVASFHAVYPGAKVPGWMVICQACGVQLKFPVFHQSVFIPKIAYYPYFSNYANSFIYPGYSHSLEPGFDIVAAKWVTLNMTYRNFQGTEYGYSFPAPQNQHYTYINFSANIHTRIGF